MSSNHLVAGRVHTKFFVILSACLSSTALVCLVVNFSVSQTISWALFPVGGIVLIWLTFGIPALFRNYKTLAGFAGFSVGAILYLLLIQDIVATKGWFYPLALPIALFALSLLGISLLAFSLFRFNKFYAWAITILLFGVGANLMVKAVLKEYSKNAYTQDPSQVYIISASIIISLLFGLAGCQKSLKPPIVVL